MIFFQLCYFSLCHLIFQSFYPDSRFTTQQKIPLQPQLDHNETFLDMHQSQPTDSRVPIVFEIYTNIIKLESLIGGSFERSNLWNYTSD